MAALLPPNALASLCLRNLAHLGHPSPKPTSPWTLLPPSLHSLMRAASGHIPTPLPGITVATQPGVRYPASLGFGGWDGAMWDKDPGEGRVEHWGCFSTHSHKAVSSGPGVTVSKTVSPFAFLWTVENELQSYPIPAHEHLMVVGAEPCQDD